MGAGDGGGLCRVDFRLGPVLSLPDLPRADVRPPAGERYDFRYQHGVSTVFMPNGSAVCVSQAVPTELQISMTHAWNQAWNDYMKEES